MGVFTLHGSPRTTSSPGRGAARHPLRQTAVLTGALLLAAGCTAAHDQGAAPVGSMGPLPTASPSPTALPYGQVLESYVSPVSNALAQLTQAGSLDDLNTALASAQQAASAGAQGLQGEDAPSAVGDTHRQLYVALGSLATDLGAVQSDISSSKVCATSSALAETGQSQGLKDVATALQTLSAAGYSSTFTVPQLPQPQQRALDNGAWVRKGSADGSGELTVDNTSGTTDAVLSLVKDGQSAYSFYVLKGKSTKVTGIEDGTYNIFFTGGLDWDDSTKKFTQSCEFTKFDDTADFTTTSSTYQTYTLTLSASVGGNAQTDTVPPDTYPVP
ncbi:hypothetical protein OG455_30675 [Kitasatospora sp. NBC_01287]|uniref:hypothetical protein n=1 Tax=Kitasatospora sp. NBC_01287 TaxID=2903573 RepID=UPI00224D5289|nr:hypothetical protein [Kitasatospora sp. NBC_01287]MCX4749830.1 hypothetical protein [Kitasatospora sp. NBC_01287]